MQNVFIIGSKGFGNYGGYETFVENLTRIHQDHEGIKYYVACKAKEDSEFPHYNATGFNIKVPNLGPAQAILYDVKALKRCIAYIKANKIEHPIVYILACRIGPFIKRYKNIIHSLGGELYINPDGHEWMRGKWSAPVKKYWKYSESKMVANADLIVCDSVNIEKYIHKEYASPSLHTTYIAYGSDTSSSTLADDAEKYTDWMAKFDLKAKEYYLVVGRFVPENNYEIMIREYMKSNTKKDFAIITTADEKFLNELETKLQFRKDPRIKFVGTVYDQELLKKIRENAYAYFHGHEVGGTNPSLLEALGSTQLNLLLNVGFNTEVADDAAMYWTKEAGNLAKLIDEADLLPEETIKELEQKAKQRITDHYSWQFIADEYERIFLKNK